MAILNYPTPHIVAWHDDDDSEGLLGGGSHFAKITRTLDYINDPERREQPGFDDELVFMLDAYDIWFQLPMEQLLSRYEGIVAEENDRVSVIFGGGKRCAPNLIHTLACYPIPPSPLPEDLRGAHTDSAMGSTEYSAYRTRYLNSGYIIGPVKDVRRVLERAKEGLEACMDRHGASYDDGSGKTDECYHGSDQSIFVEMFGTQEFQREAMRRQHRTWLDKFLDKFISGRAGSEPPLAYAMGVPVKDRLNPDFAHEANDTSYQPGKPFEMGIAIDYWSLLGHQSANAHEDGRYIRYNESIDSQIGERGRFECPGKAILPADLPAGQISLIPTEPNTWDSMPLYTEVCVAKVPVMIHHNSWFKDRREQQWDSTWWHGRSRALLQQQRENGYEMLSNGVSTDNGTVVQWTELCPRDVEPELFRDVTKDEIENEKKSDDRAEVSESGNGF
ncbi:hypothetical protein K4F52_003107 [Lecanicillium sp. MT-2017a]|nr:hypothetical protein K4F52_003107 [Lecanicillium sp. MT-2017a]